jgi:hypothetical protein
MLCTIILNANDKWTAPEWLARNLAAHLDPAFVLAKTRVKERFSNMLDGESGTVDLSNATPAEMRELLKTAELSRHSVKRPSEWEEPAAAVEFITAYDRFLNLLRGDERVN